MPSHSIPPDKEFATFTDSEFSSEYEFISTPPESVSGEKDYGEKDLPIRYKNDEPSVNLQIHPSPERDGVQLTVVPPKTPANSKLKHVPCDIVLTIDVSGSMSAEAPAPTVNPDETESNGLSVLDLVKHAARTILDTLDETDRLAIVSFSTDARVVQRLLPMTAQHKELAAKNIESLRPESMTNLWHGIHESMKLFEFESRPKCVPAIMILTDGLPNHMCPNQGYVRKLRTYSVPVSLHTFGFGYNLRSGLLKSIAEVGGGNYAFIPDSGMLGTVFIHAVANLQSTFATNVSLRVTTSKNAKLFNIAGTNVVGRNDDAFTSQSSEDSDAESTAAQNRSRHRTEKSILHIQLDHLQYGQSRDIFLKYDKNAAKHDFDIELSIEGTTVDGKTLFQSTTHNTRDQTSIKREVLIYHRSRALVCELLGSFFPLNSLSEHQITSDTPIRTMRDRLDALTGLITDQPYRKDALNASLLSDLNGPDPAGQIRLALSSTEYFDRWGKHYLLSILNAHQKQICNSFKDEGPLQYAKNSPLFVSCRDRLDKAFDSLPPPKPSRAAGVVHMGQRGVLAPGGAMPKFKSVDMRKYHRKDNPCFAAGGMVRLADGVCGQKHTMRVEDLRTGMRVQTMAGPATVVAVVATKGNEVPLTCLPTGLMITPWHPVLSSDDGKEAWAFPAELSTDYAIYTGDVFSILLEPSPDSQKHTIEVDATWAVTLGHGFREAGNATLDVRAHEFLGNYEAVASSLAALPVTEGILRCGGVRRGVNGLMCGFIPAFSDIETELTSQSFHMEVNSNMVAVA